MLATHSPSFRMPRSAKYRVPIMNLIPMKHCTIIVIPRSQHGESTRPVEQDVLKIDIPSCGTPCCRQQRILWIMSVATSLLPNGTLIFYLLCLGHVLRSQTTNQLFTPTISNCSVSSFLQRNHSHSPGFHKWDVQEMSNSTYSIKNVAYKSYITTP